MLPSCWSAALRGSGPGREYHLLTSSWFTHSVKTDAEGGKPCTAPPGQLVSGRTSRHRFSSPSLRPRCTLWAPESTSHTAVILKRSACPCREQRTAVVLSLGVAPTGLTGLWKSFHSASTCHVPGVPNTHDHGARAKCMALELPSRGDSRSSDQ